MTASTLISVEVRRGHCYLAKLHLLSELEEVAVALCTELRDCQPSLNLNLRLSFREGSISFDEFTIEVVINLSDLSRYLQSHDYWLTARLVSMMTGCHGNMAAWRTGVLTIKISFPFMATTNSVDNLLSFTDQLSEKSGRCCLSRL